MFIGVCSIRIFLRTRYILEFERNPMGALTTTRKSTGYQLQFLSPYFFSGRLQRNIDKEILRIKLVLFRVPGVAHLNTVGIDAYACNRICSTRGYLMKLMFCAAGMENT